MQWISSDFGWFLREKNNWEDNLNLYSGSIRTGELISDDWLLIIVALSIFEVIFWRWVESPKEQPGAQKPVLWRLATCTLTLLVPESPVNNVLNVLNVLNVFCSQFC